VVLLLMLLFLMPILIMFGNVDIAHIQIKFLLEFEVNLIT